MKKILTILLLLSFCTVQGTWAGDVIIIGSDGQARYENEDLHTAVVKEAVTNLTTENQDLRGKAEVEAENQEVKINIKNIDDNNEDIKKYHKKFRKYSRRDVSHFYTSGINKKLKGYKHYNYPQKDNFDLNDKNIIKVELQDGDYVILNTKIKGKRKYKYAAEYHKDGSLFGIVQIKTIHKTSNTATIAFYEYRQNEENISIFNAKHIMYLDIEKKKDKVDIAQFIYKDREYSDNLICCQINNDLYLNEEAKNLIVKMKKFDIPSESYDNVKDNLIAGVQGVGMVVAAPFIGAVAVVGVPLLFLGIMIFGFDHY